ncbi:MAG: ABC transporter substrate-binding protein [Chloroflexi bacterium]|nr:ABC transporter substrate-binding protein [Chloroflexota bacterium]
MLRFFRRIAFAALLIAFAVAAQVDLQDERILLTFIPNVQFAPFYVGIEGGYFADVGFNVSLEHLQEPEVLDLVAVGQAKFGIVSGEQVILARARGRDVVYVFEWFQQYPVGLAYDDSRDLSELEDLRGLAIGIPGRFGASYSGLTTLLQSAGLSEDDVDLREIGFNAPEVFCLGAVDAAIVYVNNEPLQMQNLASNGDCGDVAEIDVIAVAAHVDLVSNGLIVNRALLEGDPDEVARMVRGFAQALQAVIDNPAAAYLASLKHVDSLRADDSLLRVLQAAASQQQEFAASHPGRDAIALSRRQLARELAEQFGKELLTQMQVLLNTIELWDAENLGYSDLESWDAMRDTLAAMGFLDDAAVHLPEAFTNIFIPGPVE